MSKMASHEPFGHLKPKLWAKEGPGVKLAVDSRPLKVGNRPVPNVRSKSATWRWKALSEGYNFGLDLISIGGRGEELRSPKVPGLQPGTPTRDSFGTPPWESREKEPFGCSLDEKVQSILYGGRWWLPPSSGRGESCVSKCLWLVPTPKGVPKCELTLLWLVLDADSSLII
jgi:hypothetical protein